MVQQCSCTWKSFYFLYIAKWSVLYLFVATFHVPTKCGVLNLSARLFPRSAEILNSVIVLWCLLITESLYDYPPWGFLVFSGHPGYMSDPGSPRWDWSQLPHSGWQLWPSQSPEKCSSHPSLPLPTRAFIVQERDKIIFQRSPWHLQLPSCECRHGWRRQGGLEIGWSGPDSLGL